MAEDKAVEVDQQELQRAEEFWKSFTIGTKYAVYATAAVLVLLALTFVKFT